MIGIKQWYSAAELAGMKLPGMPSTKKGMLDKADRETWQRQQRAGRGGGMEYQPSAEIMAIIRERQVRHLVSEAREEGTAICGTPATGYYVANTQEELKETMDFLVHRAKHSLHLASRLSNIPLADLVGQLHLTT